MTLKPTASVFMQGATQTEHAALKAWVGVAEKVPSSKRRSLWDLGSHAHCPVMGVCLPLEQLKRLMRKAGLEPEGRSDYELHLIAVNECRRRSPLAEQVQKGLDQRFDLALQAVRGIRCEAALARHWEATVQQPDWAGALWSVLTHPACGAVLEHDLLGQVHMLQHQVGMATRVDRRQWDVLQADLVKSQAALLELQGRYQAQTGAWQQRWQTQAQELQGLREAWVQEQTQHRRSEQALEALRQGSDGLEERMQLKTENEALRQRVAELERQLRRRMAGATERLELETRHALADEVKPKHSACQVLCGNDCQTRVAQAEPERPRKVVCVGGRAAQVPAYREVVETRGAEFLYHDGGEEDSLNRLPGTLAAADLVICQVGCISHNAYWRVKEHCKRTGTPCAFVDSPSKSALERAMQALGQDQAEG